MAKAKGISFPQDKLYLYEYALNKDSNLSRYVVGLIEADYQKNLNAPIVDTKKLEQSLEAIQVEILKMKKLIN